MLGNQVELWESMLGVMKIGAVIMPTTVAVGPGDLVDRMERGEARAVITNASEVHKFDDVPGDYLRIAVGVDPAGTADPAGTEGPAGWEGYSAAYDIEAEPAEHPGTGPDDRLLLYFTSGTTSKPKLVEHTQVSYPVGHLSTMYWIGLRPGDVHLNISSPGWAKHAWSCFFAPWIAEATIFLYNYTRFDPAALLRVLRTHEVTSLCAPPTVWRMLINADLSGGPGALREVARCRRAAQPRGDRPGREGLGHDHQGRLRPDRDDGCHRQHTGRAGQARLDGTAAARACPWPSSTRWPTRSPTSVTRDGKVEGEICLDLSQQPVPLMTGYQGDPERHAAATAGGWYHTGDVASVDADGYITYVGRTDDVFKASDYKISPFELESVLIEHVAVAEAAVVPSPDPVRLAVPKAYVALVAGYEPSAEVARSILAHCRAKLAPWQRVRRIEFYELPKTISGKIRRVELRGREEELDATGAAQPELEWRDDQFPDLRG